VDIPDDRSTARAAALIESQKRLNEEREKLRDEASATAVTPKASAAHTPKP
jgi:hypothetical protein